MSNVVWAKLRYCPYWPGKIIDPPPPELKKPPRKFCVYFFGSNNYGFVDVANTCSYLQHKSKYAKKGHGKCFAEAVKQCDNYIQDPNACPSAETLSNQNQIIVANEYDYLIKKEPEFDEQFYRTEVVNIDRRTEECNGCATLRTQVDRLATEKAEAMIELSSMRTKYDLACMDAQKKDNNLRTVESSASTNHKTNELKVECLLGHKQRNNKMFLKVRWEGFDSDHDSWVSRDVLNCPAVLKTYMKLNGLN